MQVGIFQCDGGGLTVDKRLERLQQSIEKEQQNPDLKLDLVLCPELFTSGYNVADEVVSSAEAQDGPVFEKISMIAKSLETAIVYGYPEQSGDCIFNAAAFVSSEGKMLASHRKRLMAPGSFEQKYFANGSTSTILNYGGVTIGILICYEVEFPELVRETAAQGAQLILVPTALASQWSVVATRVVTSRAFENGVWLAYANHAGHENGIDYLGGSNIVAPNGSIAAQAGSEETLISAAIDLESVQKARDRLPYLVDVKRLGL